MGIHPRKYIFSRLATLIFLGSAMAATPVHAQDSTTNSDDATAMSKMAPKNEITYISWVGPYMRSQMRGFVRPYEKANGTKVHVKSYAGGIDEIRDQVESENVTWDVVDLTQADSLRACNEGLLEDLQDVDLPDGSDGTGFREDFVDGALNKCGVGVIVWATAFAFNKDTYSGNAPASIADFFDTKKYPGARAIRNDPSVIMEWALIADGVKPAEVYGILETPAGVERALKKMDAIKPSLKLWTKGSEPVRLLNGGDATMSMIWATTGATASQKEGAKFSMVWDGRVIELDLFGIPKGSRYKEEAIDFIRFASSSESLARMVTSLPNGPTRKSSLKLLSEDIQAQLPNGPAYADKVSIRSDAQWWSKNFAALKEAFDAWLAESSQQGAAGTVR